LKWIEIYDVHGDAAEDKYDIHGKGGKQFAQLIASTRGRLDTALLPLVEQNESLLQQPHIYDDEWMGLDLGYELLIFLVQKSEIRKFNMTIAEKQNWSVDDVGRLLCAFGNNAQNPKCHRRVGRGR
jgi:hypothetical protein